jgi:glycosyltransferase involved in cell wall biosynthesis
MISIIIPVFNAEQYLRRCLDSVKAQTYTVFEAILVDDGSTDSSGRICDEYARVDRRFRVVHQPNQGVSAARNRGLDLAIGDYIYFADADDELRPEALEHLYSSVIQGKYDASASGYSYVKDSMVEDRCMIAGAAPEICSSDDLMDNLLDKRDFIFYTCWNKLISRQVVSDLRFRNIKQEDFLFCGQVYLKIQSLIYLNEPLYIYYDYPSSLSKDFSYIGPHQAIKVLSLLLEEIPKERKKARGVTLMRLFRHLMTSSYFVYEWPLSQNEKEDFI